MSSFSLIVHVPWVLESVWFSVVVYSLYIIRDPHKLVTKGFLHSFAAYRAFSLGLKKLALGL